jgi:hypothetical protein
MSLNLKTPPDENEGGMGGLNHTPYLVKQLVIIIMWVKAHYNGKNLYQFVF